MNEPHMAPWWFPANDHPRDKALMDIQHHRAQATSRWSPTGGGSGRKVHGDRATTRWRADEPMVPYLAFFAAGRLRRRPRAQRDGLPLVRRGLEAAPGEAAAASHAADAADAEIVGWLGEQLGDYPFSVTGGLTTALRAGFRAGEPDPADVPRRLRPATSWSCTSRPTSGSATPSPSQNWKDIWLNEGAATFMEVRYTETHGGQARRTTG